MCVCVCVCVCARARAHTNFPGSGEGAKGGLGEGILGARHRTPRRAPFISISMSERHLVLISAT